MQKKLIAAAVAGLVSTGAMAQVTVYGLIDIGYFTIDSNNAPDDFAGLRGGLSGSRIGFSATEDLGGGLSATALLETTINADQDAGFAGTGRRSHVGLTSASMGTVVLGRLYSPGYNWAGKYDANSTSQFSSVSNAQQVAGFTSTANGAGRLNNTIGYASPNFSGFTFGAAYQFNEELKGGTLAAPADAGRVMGFNVDYTAGPLAVGAAYHSGSDIGVLVAAQNDFTEMSIGGSYDLGVAKLVATYQTLEVEPTAGGVATTEYTLVSFGASFPIGQGAIKASLAQLSDDLPGAVAEDADFIGIEYNHSLSKRTTAYVGYAKVSNDANANFRLGGMHPGTAPVGTPPVGQDVTGLGFGMRHTF